MMSKLHSVRLKCEALVFDFQTHWIFLCRNIRSNFANYLLCAEIRRRRRRRRLCKSRVVMFVPDCVWLCLAVSDCALHFVVDRRRHRVSREDEYNLETQICTECGHRKFRCMSNGNGKRQLQPWDMEMVGAKMYDDTMTFVCSALGAVSR